MHNHSGEKVIAVIMIVIIGKVIALIIIITSAIPILNDLVQAELSKSENSGIVTQTKTTQVKSDPHFSLVSFLLLQL